MNCKAGRLVHERHDATADTWIYLGVQVFQSSVCSHKPMVNEGNPCGHRNGGTGAPASAPVFWRGRWGGNCDNNCNATNTATANNTGAAEGAAASVVKGIRGFWSVGRECIFDIRIRNTESCTHRKK